MFQSILKRHRQPLADAWKDELNRVFSKSGHYRISQFVSSLVGNQLHDALKEYHVDFEPADEADKQLFELHSFLPAEETVMRAEYKGSVILTYAPEVNTYGYSSDRYLVRNPCLPLVVFGRNKLAEPQRTHAAGRFECQFLRSYIHSSRTPQPLSKAEIKKLLGDKAFAPFDSIYSNAWFPKLLNKSDATEGESIYASLIRDTFILCCLNGELKLHKIVRTSARNKLRYRAAKKDDKSAQWLLELEALKASAI